MAKKHTRHRRHKRQKRMTKSRKMSGGAFTQTELQQLHNNGFNEDQIQTLEQMNIPFNVVIERIHQLWNQGDHGFHGNSNEFAEQIMVDLLNNHIENADAIPHAEDDIHDTDMDMNLSFNVVDDSLHLSDLDNSLHLSDLNVSHDSMGANTTVGDESFNNSNLSNGSLSSVFSENESIGSETGGKKRRRRRSRKNSKGSKSGKSRKQKGGRCFGNGVGANNFDPNYSIYNTNMLKLFPYNHRL